MEYGVARAEEVLSNNRLLYPAVVIAFDIEATGPDHYEAKAILIGGKNREKAKLCLSADQLLHWLRVRR